LSALVLLAVIGGCKRKETPPGTSGATAQPQIPSVPTLPVGSPDPFVTLPSEASELFATANNALKMKKPQPAVAALQNVVDQAPEYTPGRWTLIRALAQLGRFDDVVAAYEPLIARDY